MNTFCNILIIDLTFLVISIFICWNYPTRSCNHILPLFYAFVNLYFNFFSYIFYIDIGQQPMPIIL